MLKVRPVDPHADYPKGGNVRSPQDLGTYRYSWGELGALTIALGRPAAVVNKLHSALKVFAVRGVR